MNINLIDKTPVLSRWVVKYDDLFQMPQFVQGRIVGNSHSHKNGSIVIISNIASIDLQNMLLTTNEGLEYFLLGLGKRMILLDEGDIAEIVIRNINDVLE